MKRKTIINRQQRRKAKCANYPKKIEQQKKGIFSNLSPFNCVEFSYTGIPLKKFNQIRFKYA